MHGIWISWEKHRRNLGLSNALSWNLYEIIINKQRILRYVISIYKTISLICHKKPKFIVAQNPSIVLALTITVLKYFFHYKAIVDAHNSGIFPLEGESRFLMLVSRWIQKHADLTIVTNYGLLKVVNRNSGRGVILPDRLPSVPQTQKISMSGKINLTLICTFCEDEPYNEVIMAAKLLSDDIIIHVTGNFVNKIKFKSIPPNIKLLGHISDQNYWNLLRSSDFIIDLTLRDACLVCGAYEGIALNKPMILSNTKIIKSYFSRGCIYVDPHPQSIAEGIIKAIKTRKKISEEIIILKQELIKSWNSSFSEFIKKLD